MQAKNKDNKLVDRFLNRIEAVGNKLPHPIVLFFILTGIIILVSWFVSLFDIAIQHPATGETIRVVNLLSRNGIQRMFTEAIDNFIGFAPLGVVLVAMIGVGIASKSGLITAVLKKLILGAPDRFITSAVIFTGIMTNVASDVGYVVLIPIGAIIFAAKGRHPLVGLAAAFAGVSGGFSANLLITANDPMLAGITQEAAQILNSAYTVPPTVNYYFMIISTVLITVIGTWVTESIVAPRFGEYKGSYSEEMDEITAVEEKGMKSALIWVIIVIAILLFMTVPSDGLLRNDQGNLIMGGSPFISGIVPIITLLFLIPGLAYGIKTGSIKDSNDFAEFFSESMADMSGFIALAFIAGQFVSYFNWSNLGTILAVKGADFLQTINFTGLPLILLFILVTGLINLFIGSASAKWAIMAPIFVPMLMQLSYSPEFAQMAYRVGDSVTNIITPLMTYFAIIVAFAKKYDKDIGIGTLISTMLPYSISFLIGWSLLLVIWFIFNIPIGPGSSIFL